MALIKLFAIAYGSDGIAGDSPYRAGYGFVVEYVKGLSLEDYRMHFRIALEDVDMERPPDEIEEDVAGIIGIWVVTREQLALIEKIYGLGVLVSGKHYGGPAADSDDYTVNCCCKAMAKQFDEERNKKLVELRIPIFEELEAVLEKLGCDCSGFELMFDVKAERIAEFKEGLEQTRWFIVDTDIADEGCTEFTLQVDLEGE